MIGIGIPPMVKIVLFLVKHLESVQKQMFLSTDAIVCVMCIDLNPKSQICAPELLKLGVFLHPMPTQCIEEQFPIRIEQSLIMKKTFFFKASTQCLLLLPSPQHDVPTKVGNPIETNCCSQLPLLALPIRGRRRAILSYLKRWSRATCHRLLILKNTRHCGGRRSEN
jgi:hypothetical protein